MDYYPLTSCAKTSVIETPKASAMRKAISSEVSFFQVSLIVCDARAQMGCGNQQWPGLRV
jgi:hypothetical protein